MAESRTYRAWRRRFAAPRAPPALRAVLDDVYPLLNARSRASVAGALPSWSPPPVRAPPADPQLHNVVHVAAAYCHMFRDRLIMRRPAWQARVNALMRVVRPLRPRVMLRGDLGGVTVRCGPFSALLPLEMSRYEDAYGPMRFEFACFLRVHGRPLGVLARDGRRAWECILMPALPDAAAIPALETTVRGALRGWLPRAGVSALPYCTLEAQEWCGVLQVRGRGTRRARPRA